MFYVQDLAAHEIHGPFLTREAAHRYPGIGCLSSYRVLTDTQAQNLHDPGSVRLVAKEYR